MKIRFKLYFSIPVGYPKITPDQVVICGHIGHNAINKDNDPKCRGCSRSSQA